MSTDPSTKNQDLPTNQDGAPTEESNETTKDIVQVSSDESIHNSEAHSNALTEMNQEDTPEEATENVSFNSEQSNFIKIKDEKSDDQLEVDFNDPQLFKKAINKFKLESDRLSKNNAQLEMKMDRILRENDKFHLDLTEKNKQLCLEIASLNERLAKLEESTKFKFDGLVKDALKQDDAVWDEDNEECQKYIAQAKLWHSKTETLYTSVLTAISDCGDRIDKCGDLMQEINKENSTLHNSLLDRYKSLELSKRMLERLREPIELLKKSTLPSEHLLRLQPQDLVDLLRSQNDETEAKKILAKKVKETGDTRYKSIREWRELAEKSQKQWLNFIEKKLLFALDGINDGKPYAEHLVDELKPSYQTSTCQKKLDDWLQTYVDLENILIEALKNLDITQLLVARGQPVDYDRHEPIGTEPDSNLPHESIKEVTRNGYEYKLPDQEQLLILRSAQVIVVKNK